MINKENDWFLAQSENPNFQTSNFMQAGLTPENTQLKEKSFYENNKYIQSLYQKDGKFDKATFDIMYNRAAQSFQDFSNNTFKDQLLSDYEYDMYDSTRPVGSQIKKPDIELKKVTNPLRQVYGFGGIGSISKPTITIAEAAQQSKIFDWKSQKFLDITPNDNSLENSFVGFLKSITEPLVLATYEEGEESIDPNTGLKIKHKKGDYKVNEDGDYYYETLGGRSAYGKQVKSVFDTLTIDGSKLNKYDFFDSDGLDKSVTGTIAKTAAVIAPLFTPLAPYYGYAMVGSQLMDLLPTLYNTIAGNFTDSTIPFFNQVQGIGRSLQGSTSEYSKEHLFSFENFANTVADVALQWQQQRTIANAFRKYSGVEKLQENAKQQATIAGYLNAQKYGGTEEAIQKSTKAAYEAIFNGKLKSLLEAKNRTAANAALGYMAGLQAFEVYEDTLEQGATKTEAALMAWGTALGMYKVDRTGLGELFFPELEGNAKAYRTAIQTLKKELNDAYHAANTTTKKGKFKLLDKARNASSNYWQNIKDHSLGFFGKSLGEGIEEVSEELVIDFTKSTFNMLSDLGWTSSGKKLDAWENAGDRYLMNFFGGAVGGALFYGVDLVQNGKRNNSDTKEELVYLLRNGNKKELLDEIENQRKNGKLGSKELSATKYEQNENGQLNYLTATNEADSQNDMIAKQLRDIVTVIDQGIHQEGLNYSDPEIIDKLIMADQRMSNIINVVGETGIQSRVLRDFNKVTSEIIDKLAEIKTYDSQFTDEIRSATRGKEQEHQNYLDGLNKLKQELQELKQRKDNLLSENTSKEYVDKLLFEIDDTVNSPFFITSFDQYIEAITGKTRSQLSVEQLNTLSDSYINFKEATKDEQFDTAYAVFKHFNKKYTETVNDSANSYSEYAKARELLWNELLDLQQTSIKFGLAENSNIEAIYQFFENNFNADPVLKQEYDPRNYFENPLLLLSEQEVAEFEALDESDKIIRMQQLQQQALDNYQNAQTEKFNKIDEIIEKFKQIGFIDNTSKKLLEKAIGNLNLNNTQLQPYIDQLQVIQGGLSQINVLDLSELFDPELLILDSSLADFIDFGGAVQQTLGEQLNLSNIFNQVIEQLKKLNGNNLNETLTEIDNILTMVKLSDDTNDVVINALKEVNNNEDVSDLLNSYKSAIRQIATNIDSDIKNSQEFIIKNRLQTEINTIKQNPLHNFLQKVYTEISGKTSNVLDILEELNAKLQQSGLDNFELNSVQTDEIKTALQALNIVKSLITAASSEELSQGHIFGHNAVYNDFVSKLNDSDLYGIVQSDLSYMMLQDLTMIENQLKYIQQISILNLANTLEEQRKTGEALNKVLYQILKPSGEWECLKQIEVNGIKLFEGVDQFQTPELEALFSGENVENLGQLEIDALSNIIANNFTKILNESGLTTDEVYDTIIEQLVQLINNQELTDQKTSSLTKDTKSFSAYETAIFLLSTCVLSKEEFNTDYKQELQSRSEQIVPVYPQEFSIFLSTALSKNPTIFNKLLEKIPDTNQQLLNSDKLVRLFNTIVIDGIGGAGKSTILSICKKLQLKYRNKKEVWAIAPETTQVNNLNNKIQANQQYTIDNLLEHILTPEDYADYVKFKENHNSDSELFEYDSTTHSIKLKKDLVFQNISDLGILMIDEYTHMDISAALILSQLGIKNDTVIDLAGDNFQNGYRSNTNNVIVENANKFSALTIRTPKLNISMRVNTIHKNQNTKILTSLMNIVDVNQNSIAIDRLISLVDQVLSLTPMLYYSGNQEILSGEKLVDSLTENQIRQLLDSGKNVIYVYDNPNSATKQIVDGLKANYSGQLQVLTPEEVQGLEAEYSIIDVDFNKYARDNFGQFLNGCKQLYTLTTRSQTGSYIINNGLSTFLPTLQFQQIDYYAKTPDFKDKLKELTDKRLQLLDQKLDIPESTPVSPIVRHGNTKDDVINAATQLTVKVNNSNVNKQVFLDQIGAILNENEQENADYDSLISRLLDIEQQLDNLIQTNNDLLTRLQDWKYRVSILQLFEENSDFIEFIKNRRSNITSTEEYKNIIQNITQEIDNCITNILDLSDSTKQLIQSLETDIDAFELNEETLNYNENDPMFEEDPAPEIEPEISGTRTEKIINNIRVYGFYDRVGNNNEDLGLFVSDFTLNTSEYNRAVKLYGVVKGLFTYYDLSEIPDVLSTLVTNEFQDIYSDMYPNLFNIIEQLYNSIINNQGEFNVVITKRTNEDQTINGEPYVSDYVYRLVYSFGDKEITIGSLPEPSTWLSSGSDIERASAYKNFINSQIQTLTDENPKIKIKVNSIQPSKFTNLFRTERYSLSEFQEKNPYTIVSPIYISGKDFNRTVRGTTVSGSTKGNPIVFATNCRYYIEGGVKIPITSSNIGEVYQKLREGNASGAIVRKIILDPQGQFVTNSSVQSDSIKGLFNLMDQIKTIDENEVVEFLSTQSSNTVGIRLLTTMWNWRANVKQILEITNDLDPTRRYTVGNIILEPQSNTEHGNLDMKTEVIISSDQKHIVFKNRKMLQAWENILDQLIETTCEILGFAENIIHNGVKQQLTNNSSKMLSRLIKNSGVSGIVKLGNQQVRFTGGNKVIGVLSKVYSYLMTIGKRNSIISEIDLDGIIENPNNNDLYKTCYDIVSEFRGALPPIRTNSGAFPMEALTDMFNIIFHGKKYPYSDETQNTLEFSPFPDGVFYHARLKTRETSVSGRAYYETSQYNTPNQFTTNVLVQTPNVHIDLEMDSSSETLQIPESALNKEEILNTIFSTLKITDSEIQQKISDLYDSAEATREENKREVLNTILNLPIEEANRILQDENPDKHVLYTFRGELFKFIRTNTFILLSKLGQNFPLIFEINTSNSTLKINVNKRLGDMIASQIQTHNTKGYIYYETESGQMFKIDSDNSNWEIVNGNNITTLNFNVKTTQIPNVDTNEVQTLVTTVVQQLRGLGITIENMEDLQKQLNRRTRDPRIIRGTQLAKNIADLNSMNINSCTI